MMTGELNEVEAMPRKDSDQSSDGPVIIKKYGNRRLYDTRQSKYITLEDLARIVQSGATVQVIDSTTSKDLTRQVLMQVILEQQESLDVVPVELLHAVLRVQGTLEQAPLAAYLSAMTGQFVDRGDIWAKQLVDLMGSFPMAGMTGFPGGTGVPAGAVGSATSTGVRGEGEEAASATPADESTADGMRDVRNRMDALLDKMKK